MNQYLMIALIILVILVIFVLINLIFFPGMALFNRLTDKNKTNTLSNEKLILARCTQRIRPEKLGEIQVIDSGNIFPAQLYQQTKSIEVGETVLIIQIVDGIASVATYQVDF